MRMSKIIRRFHIVICSHGGKSREGRSRGRERERERERKKER